MSVSHGTLRPQDLLRAFAEELFSGEDWVDVADYSLYDEAIAMADTIEQEGPEAVDPDDVEYVFDELYDKLNELAPEGHYFGANEGDGSDFDYWPVTE